MSQSLSLLVVDDDELVIKAIEMAVPSHWQVIPHQSPTDIPVAGYQAAFVDMHLTGDLAKAEGLAVLELLNLKHPQMQLVAMSGDLNREMMESCLRVGATRFLAKPLNTEEFQGCLSKIEALLLLQGAQHRPETQGIKWVGNSSTSQNVLAQIARLKGEKGPILISGPTGTGKEVVAKLLHTQEGAHRPFVTLNAAAISENLFESEIFGHVKGAFTGADQNKVGLAEAARDGDLFIDEIEALPATQQAKFLRFLETGEVRRVGASGDPVIVETRVIAATNVPLEELVAKGDFREDLLFRIKGKTLDLPPLNQRLEDVEPLAKFFLAGRTSQAKTLAPDAVEALTGYDWPGNVRELKRVCEQLLLVAPLPIIRAEDVQVVLPKKMKMDYWGKLPKTDLSKGLATLLTEFEGSLLRQALEQSVDVDEAARLLGMSRSTLYKKLKDHDIEWRNS